jgi:hypothetical protein
MPSSISSSERVRSEPLPGRPGLVRPTAADRPGVAQPVPERDVPSKPWPAMLAAAALVAALALGAWEARMRAVGLVPGDVGDYPSGWAEQRRRLDAGDVPVAIAGDSRILFDTDLDRFERLTGTRPVQLALVGTNARYIVEDVARAANFRGLLIVGIADTSYFRADFGYGADALARYRFESPSQRSGRWLHGWLSQALAFLDEDYRLSKLVHRLDDGWRAGADRYYAATWKLLTMRPDRAARMWSRIEQPGQLQEHARWFWLHGPQRPPASDALVADTIRRTREAVAAIRARGGEVVFLRPPSAGPLREMQERQMPRARGWEPLLREADVRGVHYQDVPAMQGLVMPEYSHLSGACATVYTDAYVRALAGLTPRLALRADAPPPLSPGDCVPRR